ncbi:hypothetical protein A4X13_0g7813 [Tilletia indica]|uniref:Uncharacterized protein n=1 Tax=Tilletia indica TaxID=43049 RepID=A0A177TEH1_9BASI|nr:hypothetical protein A4X13_0g7813 [Tilletia indica]
MQIKATFIFAACVCFLAAVPSVLGSMSAGHDGSLAHTGRMNKVRGEVQLERRGCTVGLGAHAGNASINLSLQLLTTVLFDLQVNVTDGLNQIATLDVSAVSGLENLANEVTSSIKTAFGQLAAVPATSNTDAPASKRDDAGKADDAAETSKLEESVLSLVTDAAAAFGRVQQLVAQDQVDAETLKALQGVIDGLTSILIVSRSMDPALFDNADIKAQTTALLTAIQSTPGLDATLLSKVVSGQKLNRRDGELINIGFGVGLGPNIGAGGGLTVGPEGIGGGFNAGVGDVGVGGGINCN